MFLSRNREIISSEAASTWSPSKTLFEPLISKIFPAGPMHWFFWQQSYNKLSDSKTVATRNVFFKKNKSIFLSIPKCSTLNPPERYLIAKRSDHWISNAISYNTICEGKNGKRYWSPWKNQNYFFNILTMDSSGPLLDRYWISKRLDK